LEDIFIGLTKDAVDYHGVTGSTNRTHDSENER
jgi:hypothetical protein